MLKEVLKSGLYEQVRRIEVPYDPINEGSTDAILKSAGNQVPLVQICNTLINQQDINYCRLIVGKSFLPQLELSFNGEDNFIDNDFPLVKDLVTVYIGNVYDTEYKTIKIDFEIVNCEMHGFTVVVTGKMWLEFMKLTDIQTYKDLTSFKVLKKFCEEHALGLVTNIDDTDDQMTWIQCNETNEAFLIDHVIRHMWVADNVIVRTFIDPWYRLVVCDMFKEMEETPKDDQIIINRFNGEKLDPVQKLILTNDANAINTMCKFNAYELMYNQKSLTTPSKVDMQFMNFDMASENYQQSIEPEFIKAWLQNLSTDKEQDVMADFIDNLSLQVVKRDEVHANVHPHWHQAALIMDWSQGLFDRVIFKLCINGTLNQLYVYKTINVEVWKESKRYPEPIPQGVRRDEVEVNDAAKYQPNAMNAVQNQRLSGKYMITSLTWEYTKSTNLQQFVECQRRMWPLFDVTKLK